jgi:hypothetical protein
MPKIADMVKVSGNQELKDIRETLPKHATLDPLDVATANLLKLVDMCSRRIRELPLPIQEQTKKVMGLMAKLEKK